jgi:hypothetical protein
LSTSASAIDRRRIECALEEAFDSFTEFKAGYYTHSCTEGTLEKLCKDSLQRRYNTAYATGIETYVAPVNGTVCDYAFREHMFMRDDSVLKSQLPFTSQGPRKRTGEVYVCRSSDFGQIVNRLKAIAAQ